MLRCCLHSVQSLLLLLVSLLCTVFYFVLFWSLSSNNELQLELRRVFCLHCFFFLLCLIYRIHLTQLSLSLLTIVIYVAHCSTASIPLSRSLSLSLKLVVLHSNKLHCSDGVDCIFGIVVLSLSLCLCLGLCLCAAPLCVDLSGANTLSAHSGQIFMLCLFIIVFISLLLCCFFLSSCRTVAVVIVVFCLFMAFFRCTCAKFKAALSSPYQRRRRRSLNS